MEATKYRTQEDKEVFATSLAMTFNFSGVVDIIAQAFLSCLVSSSDALLRPLLILFLFTLVTSRQMTASHCSEDV